MGRTGLLAAGSFRRLTAAGEIGSLLAAVSIAGTLAAVSGASHTAGGNAAGLGGGGQGGVPGGQGIAAVGGQLRGGEEHKVGIAQGGAAVNGAAVAAGDGRIHNQSELTAGLRKFYQETGVQPYVYILPNGESTSVSDLKSRAEALYPQLFSDEGHFLLVFCDDGRGGYNCGYTVGSQAKTVMDDEAVSILADYLDRYYNDSSVSEEEIFSNAFAKTADRIMTVTQSPVVPVAVCIAAVIVIALLVFSLQKRREAKERQRQADEKMWSTPLESFGADEAAERAKKYENTDTHTQ